MSADVVDVLISGTLAVLWGKWGGGKSFVALDWALSIATDCWWMHREVRGGSVLYVAAEGGAGLGPRIDAWQKDRAICDVRAFRSDETVSNARGLPRGTRPRAVTTEVIRSVPAAQVTGELRRGLKELTEFASRQAAQSKRKRATLARRGKQLAVSGRQLYDRDHFLRVADTYEAAWGKGENPTKAVADKFGTTRSAAGKWVYRARHEFGLLGPTEQR